MGLLCRISIVYLEIIDIDEMKWCFDYDVLYDFVYIYIENNFIFLFLKNWSMKNNFVFFSW